MSQAGGVSSNGGGPGSGAIFTINTISPNGSGDFTLTAGSNITLTPGTNSLTIAAASTGISTITGDSGSITGSNVTIETGNSTNTSGSSFLFANSGSTSILKTTDANKNIFIGQLAGNLTTTGVENTVFGYGAMSNVLDGSFNVGVGYLALQDMTHSIYNVAVGFASVSGTGDGNTGLGYASLGSLTTGSYNLAAGYNSGSNLSSSNSNNILLGNFGVTGDNNTIRIGDQGTGNAQQNKCFIAGIFNVNSSGFSSPLAVFVDSSTGQLGYGTAISSITISGNSGGPLTGTSFNFLTANSTVKFAGASTTETVDFGISNLLLGSAGASITSATNNVSLGAGALTSITSGAENNALGVSSLSLLLSGIYNVSIGYNTGSNYISNESSNILISSSGVLGDNNTTRIGTDGSGSGQQNKVFMAGISGVSATGFTTPLPVYVDTTTGQLGFGAAFVSVYPLTVVNSSPFVANATTEYYYSVDTSTTAITIRLPDTPVTGKAYIVKDKAGNASLHNITVTTVAGTDLFDGATSITINQNYASASFIFNGSSWEIF